MIALLFPDPSSQARLLFTKMVALEAIKARIIDKGGSSSANYRGRSDEQQLVEEAINWADDNLFLVNDDQARERLGNDALFFHAFARLRRFVQENQPKAEELAPPKVEAAVAKTPLDSLIGKIVGDLERGRPFRCDLSDKEVLAIMDSLIKSIIPGSQAVNSLIAVGGVEKMNVTIEGRRGTVSGEVVVTKPLNIKIPVKCVLGNGKSDGKLSLVQLDIGSFFTKPALTALGKASGHDIQQEAAKRLRDPVGALGKVLASQLESKGFRLSGCKMWFGNGGLSVLVEGQPLPRR